MDDSQRIVKCGNLSLHSPGGFFKKRWPSKYLVLYDGSKSGIKRLELFDSEIKFKKQNPAKIIPLVDCIRVVTCQRGHKTNNTFEVRMSEQLYLLSAQSFQDMNDWVNCIRLVAFGQPQAGIASNGTTTTTATANNKANNNSNNKSHGSEDSQTLNGTINNEAEDEWSRRPYKQQFLTNSSDSKSKLYNEEDDNNNNNNNNNKNDNNNNNNNKHKIQMRQVTVSDGSKGSSQVAAVDVLLEKTRSTLPLPPTSQNNSNSEVPTSESQKPRVLTATQAAAAAANALARTRQRQPSLFGSCKPQPPTDSPFIVSSVHSQGLSNIGQGSSLLGHSDHATMTPTVRGQLISSTSQALSSSQSSSPNSMKPTIAKTSASSRLLSGSAVKAPATLDEEEENMLYCSIEDNPSEHNYRVKVIETELALRCQLKCYQLIAPTVVDEQYEELSRFSSSTSSDHQNHLLPPIVTFYQLIIGPQELTLLNDYALRHNQQQGLWSWPYQCIRRYGFDKYNCFMFEAGRKCTSGPGQFIVQTPKAYNIYQDVVKFVNELRTLSNTNENQQSLNVSIGNNLNNNSNNNDTVIDSKPSITQIPVTWTPAQVCMQTANLDQNSSSIFSSKQQFFKSLQNLDTVHSKQQQRPTMLNTNSSMQFDVRVEPTRDMIDRSKSAASLKLLHQEARAVDSNSNASSNSGTISPKSQSSNTNISRKYNDNEETDESGYEHGCDDSVDGSSTVAPNESGLRSSAARSDIGPTKITKSSRPEISNHPIQNSSNQSSIPIYSVINKKQPNNQIYLKEEDPKKLSINQRTSDEPKISLRSGEVPIKGSKSGFNFGFDQRLNRCNGTTLMQQDDFESNLIRDVYSEISKLHATFAIATTEDSMSSHSSNSVGSSENYNQDPESAGSTDESSNSLNGRNLVEPTYSNVRTGRHQQANTGSQQKRPETGRNRQTSGGCQSDPRDRNMSKPSTRPSMSSSGPNTCKDSYRPPLKPKPSFDSHINVNSYEQQDVHNYFTPKMVPLYMRTLNPIPENGEPSSMNNQKRVMR